MDSAADRYRRWFVYEQDSHEKVLAALAAVPDEARAQEGYQKALTLMAHIVAARWLWLTRLHGTQFVPEGFAPQTVADFFPADISFAEISTRVAEMHAGWARYLEMLTDDELTRVFIYQSLDGARFQNTVEDILAQLFGHSWYHRGQIALVLRSIGAQPATTDLVFWARQPAP